MSTVATTKMSSRGQVVIPEAVRNEMGLKPGDQFVVLAQDDVIILKRISTPPMKDFDALIKEARRQAKAAGFTRADVAKAIASARDWKRQSPRGT